MNNSLSALRALVYFDIFDYPLTGEEIGFFMDKKISPAELSRALEYLVSSGLVKPFSNYYSLRNASTLVKRREAGNLLASSLMPRAFQISSFLYHFPFVRGIGISGSLSKNFANDESDIDYFIVTKANRLWITRTFMHLFKKLTFLAGKQHYFCMNYYVDEEGLAIQERNLFTAVEVATLIPVCGNGSMEGFFEANAWVENYYPNYVIDSESRKNIKHSLIKRSLEFLIDLLPVQWIDNLLMKITTRRWKLKEEEHRLNSCGRRLGLQTNQQFSKPNPEHMQRQILELFDKKYKEMKEKLELVPGIPT